ncbi:hypothetical protein BpHYR1_006235 [Brachionus plicatilis]|uniref:Uncharacterized protein n=1 Tax=Brachionus plicatilis TaxID=10195 RepID=A0A3M7S8W5_BRAPC|nr:hypothetical protein BpHYR1_006235 [Brachionus plicatilis]
MSIKFNQSLKSGDHLDTKELNQLLTKLPKFLEKKLISVEIKMIWSNERIKLFYFVVLVYLAMANVERCDPAVYRQQWEYYYSDYILVDRFEPSLYLMGFMLMIYTGKYLVQNIQNTSASVSAPVVYNKNGSY